MRKIVIAVALLTGIALAQDGRMARVVASATSGVILEECPDLGGTLDQAQAEGNPTTCIEVGALGEAEVRVRVDDALSSFEVKSESFPSTWLRTQEGLVARTVLLGVDRGAWVEIHPRPSGFVVLVVDWQLD